MKGYDIPTMVTNRQRNTLATEDFLATHEVFTLQEMADALGPGSNRRAVLERVKHHRRRGRLKRVAKELYAAVPRGVSPRNFVPDRYLVAASARADGILSHHAAIELLGVAHSEMHVCTVLCSGRRAPIRFGDEEIRFLVHPTALLRAGAVHLGVRSVERKGRLIRFTGPERILIDGFRQPRLVGGVEELVESAAGFGVLDLNLLEELLAKYRQKALWACIGWFLERHRERFFVPEKFLARIERKRPLSPHYVPRGRRGGRLSTRWNLVLPEGLSLGWEGA
jgi:predicted transcriptional regulator of viral defense system